MRAASPDNVADLIAKPPLEYTPEPRKVRFSNYAYSLKYLITVKTYSFFYRYVSKYRDKIIKASKRGKSAHKTFGVPSVVLDTPGQRREKRSVSAPKRPEVHHRHYRRPDYQRKLPEWKPVKASELAKQSSANRVDFAKLNAEEAKSLRPRKARMYCVDDRHGHAYPLMLSGMFPYYRNKKSYGQVPGKVPVSGKRHAKPRAKSSPQRVARADNTKPKRSKRHEASPGRGIARGPKEERKNRARSKERRERSPGRGIARGRPKEEMKNRARSKERRERSPGRGAVGTALKKPEVKHDRAKKERMTSVVKKERMTSVVKKERVTSVVKTEAGEENDKSEGSDIEREGSASSSISESQVESTGTKAESSDESSKTSDDKDASEEDRKSQVGSSKSVANGRMSTARTVEYQQPRCRYVTEDERAELLYGMKKKWDEMMKLFQCLPFMTDTPPKAKRKSRMEKDLLQLEKDIETIERHPYIYVYSDPED